MYKLDPLGDGVIVSHKEGHKRGIASNHGDPEHLWKQLGMGYTMDTFRKAVKNAMGTTTTVEKAAFNVGDKVKMSNDATVYGKTTKFASFVYKSTLYVRQIDGDRIVISTLKTGAVTGAVDKKYLTKM